MTQPTPVRPSGAERLPYQPTSSSTVGLRSWYSAHACRSGRLLPSSRTGTTEMPLRHAAPAALITSIGSIRPPAI